MSSGASDSQEKKEHKLMENMLKISEAPPSLKADVWAHFGFKTNKGTQGIDKTSTV